MKFRYGAIAAMFFVAGCVSTNNDKTPQTKIGQLNSCMLNEIYNRKDSGKLVGKYDNQAIAQEVLNVCVRKLEIPESEINRTQSLNIAISVLKSIK